MTGESIGSIEYSDNTAAPEFFATGLFRIELLGPNSRLVFYVEKLTASGVPYWETCFSVILPNSAVREVMMMMLRVIGPTIAGRSEPERVFLN